MSLFINGFLSKYYRAILAQKMKLHDQKLRELGLAVIQVETQAVTALAAQINDNFVAACKLMFACTGRVVAPVWANQAYAARLHYTGEYRHTCFCHPGEASHGDLGMITRHDVVLPCQTRETEEVLTILPIIKR
jgi:arabinose-5-phosphate isomerase